MDLHIPILTFLCVAVVVVSNAELSPEIYWKKMLPATPMPIAVKDSLPLSEWTDDKSTSVNVGKGGVNVNTPKQRGGAPTNVNVGPHSGVGVTAGGGNGKGGANVGVGKGGVTVKTGPKKKPVYVGVKPGANPFLYRYAASETQLHDDPNMALFFLEKDMRPESNMRTRLTKGTGGSTFLTREEAKSIPFSSNKMSEILNRFSVQLESKEADSMKETVKECEEKGVEGEEKYCPTSLESMVDYATSKMGKNIKAVSTEASGRNIDKTQNYKITRVRKIRATNNEAIACHKQSYPYAVFYCHKTKATTAYTVSMVGTEGANVNAVAVCYHDTSAWNPKHLAFQVLKVKPGSVPVCHFLPEDHIVWFRN